MAGWFKSLKPRTKFLGLILGILVLAGVATAGYSVYRANVSASIVTPTYACVKISDSTNTTYAFQGGDQWKKKNSSNQGDEPLSRDGSNFYYSAFGRTNYRTYSLFSEGECSTAGNTGASGGTGTSLGKSSSVCFIINNVPITYTFKGSTNILGTSATGASVPSTLTASDIGFGAGTTPQVDINSTVRATNTVDGKNYEGKGGPCSGSSDANTGASGSIGGANTGASGSIGGANTGTNGSIGGANTGGSGTAVSNMTIKASAFTTSGKQVTDVAFNYRYNTKNGWAPFAGGDIRSGNANSSEFKIADPNNLTMSFENIEVKAYKNLKDKGTITASGSEPASKFFFKAGQTYNIKFTFNNLTDAEAAAAATGYSAAAGGTNLQAGVTGQGIWLPAGNANVSLSASVLSLADPTSFTDAGGAELTVRFFFPNSLQNAKTSKINLGDIAYAQGNSGLIQTNSGGLAENPAGAALGANLGYQINVLAPYDKAKVQPYWGIGKNNFDTAISGLTQTGGGTPLEREVTIHIPDEPYPVHINGIAEGSIVQVDVNKSGYTQTSWWAKLTAGENNLTKLPTALNGQNPEPPKIKSGEIEIVKALLPNYHVYKAKNYTTVQCSAGYAMFIEEFPYPGWQCAEYDEKTNTWPKPYINVRPNIQSSTGNYGIGMFPANNDGLIGAFGVPNTAAGRAQPCGMSDLLSMGGNAKNKPDLLSVFTGGLMYEQFRQSERAAGATQSQAQANAAAKALLIASGRSFTISKSNADCYGLNSVPPGLILNNPWTNVILGVAQGLYSPANF